LRLLMLERVELVTRFQALSRLMRMWTIYDEMARPRHFVLENPQNSPSVKRCRPVGRMVSQSHHPDINKKVAYT
jgi:hypothetical protein